MDEGARNLLENALDAVITIDAEGRVLEWNRQAEETFGWARTEAIGELLSRLIIPERYRRGHDEGMKHYLATGEGPVLERRLEIEGQGKHGREIPVELTIHPLKSDSDVRFTAFVRDLTDRQAIERMKNDLVSTVSHELRTPLTSLRGFVELLLERDPPADKRREYLEIIDHEARRLTRLVGDFLDVQKLEAGSLGYQKQSLDLGELVQEVLEVFANNETRQALELDLEPVPEVWGDADRISQVLTNLLSNAIKFSPEPGTVRVRVWQEGKDVLLAVRDEGIGISSKEQGRLFEKFYRADDARLRAIGGSGLGLALVRQIVEDHHGKVGVSSELGLGSRFTITLPAVPTRES